MSHNGICAVKTDHFEIAKILREHAQQENNPKLLCAVMAWEIAMTDFPQ